MHEVQRIIKLPVYKEMFYGQSDLLENTKDKYNYLYLVGETNIAVVYFYMNNISDGFDVIKIVYDYNIVNESPYVLNLTNVNYDKSIFTLTNNTRIDKLSCADAPDRSYQLSETLCNKNIIEEFEIELFDSIIIKISTVSENKFKLTSDNITAVFRKYSIYITHFIIIDIAYMDSKINSPLETYPIQSYTFSYYDGYGSYYGFTPGYKFSINIASTTIDIEEPRRCSIDIQKIESFKDHRNYTTISSEDKNDLYCFRLNYDIFNVYCSYNVDIEKKWFINIYLDNLIVYPKFRINIIIYILIIAYNKLVQNLTNAFYQCGNDSLLYTDYWFKNITEECYNDYIPSEYTLKSNNLDENMLLSDNDNKINAYYINGNLESNELEGYFLLKNQFIVTKKSKLCSEIVENYYLSCTASYIYDMTSTGSGNNFVIKNITLDKDKSIIITDSFSGSFNDFEDDNSLYTIYDPYQYFIPEVKEVKNDVSISIQIKQLHNPVLFAIKNEEIINLYMKVINGAESITSKVNFIDENCIKASNQYLCISNTSKYSVRIYSDKLKYFNKNLLKIENNYYFKLDNKYYKSEKGDIENITEIEPIDNINDTISETIKIVNNTAIKVRPNIENMDLLKPIDNYEQLPDNNINKNPEEIMYEGSSGRVINRNDDDDDDGLSGGAIAGIVIACIIVVIIIAIILICICEKNKKKKEVREIDPYQYASKPPKESYVSSRPAAEEELKPVEQIKPIIEEQQPIQQQKPVVEEHPPNETGRNYSNENNILPPNNINSQNLPVPVDY